MAGGERKSAGWQELRSVLRHLDSAGLSSPLEDILEQVVVDQVVPQPALQPILVDQAVVRIIMLLVHQDQVPQDKDTTVGLDMIVEMCHFNLVQAVEVELVDQVEPHLA